MMIIRDKNTFLLHEWCRWRTKTWETIFSHPVSLLLSSVILLLLMDVTFRFVSLSFRYLSIPRNLCFSQATLPTYIVCKYCWRREQGCGSKIKISDMLSGRPPANSPHITNQSQLKQIKAKKKRIKNNKTKK